MSGKQVRYSCNLLILEKPNRNRCHLRRRATLVFVRDKNFQSPRVIFFQAVSSTRWEQYYPQRAWPTAFPVVIVFRFMLGMAKPIVLRKSGFLKFFVRGIFVLSRGIIKNLGCALIPHTGSPGNFWCLIQIRVFCLTKNNAKQMGVLSFEVHENWLEWGGIKLDKIDSFPRNEWLLI